MTCQWIWWTAFTEDDSWDIFWYWIYDRIGTLCLPHMNTEASQCDACNDVLINASLCEEAQLYPGTSFLDAKDVPCNLEEIKYEVIGDHTKEKFTGGRMHDRLEI